MSDRGTMVGQVKGRQGSTREVSEDGFLPGDPYIVQLKSGKDWEVAFDFY